jgi:hypothetical protein
VKNEQYLAAQEFINRAGYDPIGEEDLLTLIRIILSSKPVVFEPKDFVLINQGMGDYGYGWITGQEQNVYKVKMWAPDPDQYYDTTASVGDVMRLSSEEDAARDYEIQRIK